MPSRTKKEWKKHFKEQRKLWKKIHKRAREIGKEKKACYAMGHFAGFPRYGICSKCGNRF